MTKKQALQLFEQKKVRTIWDEEQEKWYFAIVDVVADLTEQDDYLKSRKYWNKLKQRLKEEGYEKVTNCNAFKLQAADGKMRLTDVADTEQLFRLIQSIREVAKMAREQLEAKIGKSVISHRNAKDFHQLPEEWKWRIFNSQLSTFNYRN